MAQAGAGVRVAGAVRVRVPLRRPMVTAHGSWAVCDSWLVRLVDADGRAGLGEATLGPFASALDQVRLDDVVRSLVGTDGVGEGAAAGAATAGAADDAGDGADDAVVAAARSAVAGALADMAAVADLAGRSGPVCAAIAVNAMIGAEARHAAVAAAREAVSAGFGTLKLKAGAEASTAELVERLREVRAAVGEDVALRLDVNGAWPASVARERLRGIAAAELDLEYVEQPVAPGTPEAVAEALVGAREATGGTVPLALDESVTGPAAVRVLLASKAVDVLVVKPARVGGPAAALAIAAAAARAGVGVTISTMLETGIGLRSAMAVAAAIDGTAAHGLGTGGMLANDLVGGRSVVHGGRAVASGGRGVGGDGGPQGWLGLDALLDRDAVERFAVERIEAW